jgi:hypothetical protein
MKYFLILFLSVNAFAFEHKIGLTTGQGQVVGEAVSSTSIDYHLIREADLIKNFYYGFGARYTRLQSNAFAIYKDSEVLNDLSVDALNIAIYSEYRIKKFKLGFNIDVFGQTFGSDSTLNGGSTELSPVSSNILLGGENDEGTLNSEFFLGYQVSDSIALRGGIAHIVTHFQGDNPKGEKRQRFFDVFFLSVQFNL